VFGQGIVGLSAEALAALDPIQKPVDSSWTAAGTAVAIGAVSSNGEARRLVSQGGLYINDERVTDPNAPLPEPLHGRYWVIRTGKKNTRILERA
jgi:tyrosyl-tRNA synthetase